MTHRLLLLALPIAALQTAAAACPTAAALSELNRDVDRAERAYGTLDLDGFMSSSDALRADLPCLGEPMTRVVAARIHRVEGLRGFVDSDRRAAAQSFAAARSLEPDYRFPEDLVPSGYPEWELYDAIDLTLGGSAKVDPMIDGYILFDGKVGPERPTEWAAIVQIINEEGEVVNTAYLRPGQPMPSYYPEESARAAANVVDANPNSFKTDPDDDPFADVLDEDDGGLPRLTTRTTDEPPPRSSSTSTTTPRTTSSSTTSSSTTTPRPSTSTTTTPRPSTSTTTPRPSTSTTTPRSNATNNVRSATSQRDDIEELGQHEPKKKPVGLLTFSLLTAATSGVSYGVALHTANDYRDTATALEDLDALRLKANIWSGVAAGAGLVALGSGIAVGVAW